MRQEFKDNLRGELIQPTDAGYDDARKVERMIDKSPALIARCMKSLTLSRLSTSPETIICWWLCVEADTKSQVRLSVMAASSSIYRR